MEQYRKLITVFSISVIVISLIEAIVLSRREKYDWRAFGISLLNTAVRTTFTALVPLSLATPIFAFVYEHRIATVQLSAWPAFFLLFIGQEFCYYWWHRGSHRIRWFWASHAVHHTATQINISVTYRI